MTATGWPAPRLARLAAALAETGLAGTAAAPTAADLVPLPAAGVAHDHVAIRGAGRVVRLPRMSQSGRAAADNLTYQAACFARAAASGATPRLHGLLQPSADWPMGGLVVDAVAGRPPRLPDDLPAIARCLAAIHALPAPPAFAPLPLHADPVGATLAAIAEQAAWLDRADLAADSVALIRGEIAMAQAAAPALPAGRPPHLQALVVSDAHPGNYLVDADGKAWFVDLEKAAYGQPAIDIAHVTLPTSTGWDRRVAGSVAAADVAAFESAWLAAVPAPVADAVRPWLAPLRRLTWLRTVTWFARWRARSGLAGDPWSAADLPPPLRAHMAAHVASSLAPQALRGIQAILPRW
ncbi:MAG: phosphotransferase [Alphaproteobacteria bacterium]